MLTALPFLLEARGFPIRADEVDTSLGWHWPSQRMGQRGGCQKYRTAGLPAHLPGGHYLAQDKLPFPLDAAGKMLER